MMDAADTETYHSSLGISFVRSVTGRSLPARSALGMIDSKETDIRSIGAVCIVCGFMPKLMVEPAPKHRFRPVEWKWTIKDQDAAGRFNAASIPADQSPD